MHVLARPATLAAALLACPFAHAARPMVTDDASIVAPRECQVEAWTDRHPGDIQYWAVPHCNPGGDWELAAGAGELRPTPAHASTSGLLLAKTVFRPLEPNGWSAGMTLANQFGRGSGLLSNATLNGLLTFSLMDDAVRVHVNAGWLRVREARSGPSWGLGGEWTADPRWSLTLETYGQGSTYAQAGLRYAALSGQVILDAALGDRINLRGKERYLAFGLTFTGLSLR